MKTDSYFPIHETSPPRMNIFFLSFSAKQAAEYHCDKHVVKMILETAQLLYSAHWMLNPSGLPDTAYKITHKNNPCAIWVRASLSNYMWLADLGHYLCEEYRFRYGNKTHKTESHINWLRANPPIGIVDIGVTTIYLAMPNEYKCGNPVESYRTYYRENKYRIRNIIKYTKRSAPAFLF